MRQSVSCLFATLAALVLGIVATRHVHVVHHFTPFYSAQVHVCLFAAALAGASFLVRRNWPAAVLVVAGLAMAAHLPVRVHAFGDMASPQEAEGLPRLRVLSFNVLNDNLEGGPDIRDEILRSGADIAVVLEAEPLQPHLGALAAAYPYRLGCGVDTDTCDLMLLSKHPFTDKAVGDLSDLRRHRFMRATVEIAGQPVNIVAAHLSKPYFDDYHTAELWRLWRRIDRLRGPLVLAGDFNAASIAPDMMWFLRRSGLTKAPYEPATWPIPLGVAGIAIDHIYARAPMRMAALNRIAQDHGSNHYGLIADLVIGEAPLPLR